MKSIISSTFAMICLFFSAQVMAETVTVNQFTVEITGTSETEHTGTIVGVDSEASLSGELLLNDEEFVHNDLPLYITAIGDNAFHSGASGTSNKLSGVTSITLNLSRLTSLGAYTFRDCSSLTSVTLGEGITTIGREAFRNCKALTSIIIPGSVTTMGNSIFYDCSALQSVEFAPVAEGSENPPIAIGYDDIVVNDSRGSMFKRNTALTNVTLARNFTYANYSNLSSDNKYAPFSDCSSITSVSINEGCDSISSYLFNQCTALAKVNIWSSSLSEIREYSFRNCTSLTDITIPGSVTTMGNSVFDGCSSLSSVTFEANESGTPLAIGYNGSNSMFYGNTALTDVTLARDFTYAATATDSDFKYAPFAKCSSITTLFIDMGCTTLGDYAFRDCTGLTDVYMSDGILTIGKQAFRNCEKITNLAIAGSVTEIGNSVFYDCDALASVAFLPHNSNTPLQVGYDDIVIADKGKDVGSLFRYNSNLKDVNISRNITLAEGNTYTLFANNPYITSVNLNEGCTTISSHLFEHCTALKDVTISEGINTIGFYAFNGCTALPVITLPESLQYIEANTFLGCSNLSVINVLPTTPPTVSDYSTTNDPFFSATLHVRDEALLETYRNAYYWQGFSTIATPTGTGAYFEYNGMMFQIIDTHDSETGGTAKMVKNTITTLTGIVDIPEEVINPITEESYRVIAIDANTFEGCTDLEGVIIPKNVTENPDGLATGTFTTANRPNFIVVFSTADPLVQFNAEGIFDNDVYVNTTLYVPKGKVDAYKGATPWSGFSNIVEAGLQGTQFVVDNVLYEIGWVERAYLVRVVDREAYAGDVVVPQTVICPYTRNEHPVTRISEKAFFNCYYIEKITVGGNVFEVHNTAFKNCNQLREIVFEPATSDINPIYFGFNYEDDGSMFKYNSALRVVRTARTLSYLAHNTDWIYPNASDFKYLPFGDCRQITTLHIEEGCTEIPFFSFRDCINLTTVTIAEGVWFINDEAFRNCEKLTEITLPGSLTKMGNSVFFDCDALQEITFNPNPNGEVLKMGYDHGYEYIGGSSKTTSQFGLNKNLKTVNLARTIEPLYIEEVNDFRAELELLIAPFATCKNITTVNLYEGCTSLYPHLFRDCINIENVHISEGLQTIGAHAFRNCEKLTEITLPGSLTEIGNSAFYDCDALEAVTFLANDKFAPLKVGYNDIENKNGSLFKHNTALKSAIIARNFTYAKEPTASDNKYAPFSDCQSTLFTNVRVEEGCTRIGNYMFNACKALNTVYVACDTIGERAFNGCTALTDLTIDEGVKQIDAYAFVNCSALNGVTLPASLTSFAVNTFHGCTNIGTIYAMPETPPTATGSENPHYSLSLYVKDDEGIIDQYRAADYWKNFTISTPNSVGALFEYEGLMYRIVTMPEGETKGEVKMARNFTTTLKDNIMIPTEVINPMTDDTFTVIGIEAGTFEGCTDLESVIIPNSITERTTGLDNGLFDKNNRPDFIVLLSTEPASMSEAIFSSDVYSNTKLYVPEGMVNTYKSLLPWSKFSTISTSSSSGTRFAINGLLYEVIDSDTKKVKVVEADDNTLLVGDVVIPATVTSPFNNVEYSVTEIQAKAFYNCYYIEKITVGGNVVKIGNTAFKNCNELKEIIFERNDSNEALQIGYNTENKGAMFKYNNKLKTIRIARDFKYSSSIDINDTKYAPFSDCHSIEEVYIMDGCTTIPHYLFTNSEYITDVHFNTTTLTTIDEYAFYYCFSIKEITLPASLTTVKFDAFHNCKAMHTLTIAPSESDTPIYFENSSWAGKGYFGAFMLCTELKTVNVGRRVTYEEHAPFAEHSEITTVNILAECPEVSEKLFRDVTNLTTVNFEEGVQKLATDAFRNCSKITSITLPESVTEIGTRAFRDCKALTSLTMGSNVQKINSEAFRNCEKLPAITIPGSVVSIGNNAFYDCDALAEITFLPNTSGSNPNLAIGYITEGINNSMFMDCDNLTTVNIARNFSYSESDMIYAPFSENESITTVTFSEGCTKVGKFLFRDCTKLQNVTLIEGITSIAEDAFRNCESLASLTIPASVQTLGYNALMDCSGLTTLRFEDSPETLLMIKDYKYDWPDTYLRNATSLQDVYIGRNLKIEDGAQYGIFTELKNLKNVTFSNHVTFLDKYIFEKTNITSIELPQSLETIYYGAFKDCTKLTELTIPGNVTLIENAFSGCTGITTVTLEKNDDYTPIAIAENYILDHGLAATFFVSTKLHTVNLSRNITLYEKDEFLPFEACTSIETLNIGDGCNKLSAKSFHNCTGLKTINIAPECEFVEIADEAFYNCKNVETPLTFNMAEGATIGARAFRDCVKVPSFTLSEGVVTLGDEAFRNCEALTEITIPGSVTKIGNIAFYDCDALAEITFLPGNQLLGIGHDDFVNNGLFVDNTALKTVNLNRNLMYTQDYPPFQNSSIETIIIGCETTKIGSALFKGCTNLTKIDFAPNATLSEIGYNAFNGCSQLATIELPASLSSIENMAFSGCSELSNIRCLAANPPVIEEATFDDATYDNSSLSVLNSSLKLYKEDQYWGKFFGFEDIEAKITCNKNYVLDHGTLDNWNYESGYEYKAIFTNVINGTQVTVEQWTAIDNINYTNILFYLSEGNAEITLGSEGPHYFTHVEFMLMDGETVVNTTGRLYYDDTTKYIYSASMQQWIYENMSTYIEDAVTDDEVTIHDGKVTARGAIYVYNMSGAIVAHGYNEVNISDLAQGVYIILTSQGATKVVL